MKCKKCGQPASIKMPQHNMALCRKDYLVWFVEQTRRVIEKYNMFSADEKILVAVSGGKDSLALWDVLHRLGYQADGLYIDLGIVDPQNDLAYSHKSKQVSRQFADQNSLKLHIVDLKSIYGETITAINQRKHFGRQKPCALCGLVKRHIMNQIAHEEGYDVLATGHNLDDEAAALFGNTLIWSMEHLQRQNPVLPADTGFTCKVKPLCRFYERETTAYVLMRNITYVYEECPYAVGSRSIQYKKLLNRLEKHSPGTKTNFYVRFLQVQPDLFPQPSDAIPPGECCPVCGQPTLSGEICAFCRIMGMDHQEDPSS